MSKPSTSTRPETTTSFNIPPNLKYKLERKYKSPNPSPAPTFRPRPSSATPSATPSTTPTNHSKINTSYTRVLKGDTLNISGVLESRVPSDKHRPPKHRSKENSSRCNEFSIHRFLEEKAKQSEKKKQLFQVSKEVDELKSKLYECERKKQEELSPLISTYQKHSQSRKNLETEIQLLRKELEETKTPSASKQQLQEEQLDLQAQYSNNQLKLAELQKHYIPRPKVQEMQEKLNYLESTQQSLLRENQNLKRQILAEQNIQLQPTPKQKRENLRDLAIIQKEISITKSLIDSIYKGENVNLGFILGPGPISENDSKEVFEVVSSIKKELQVLREIVTEVHEEASGKPCAVV